MQKQLKSIDIYYRFLPMYFKTKERIILLETQIL